MSQIQTRKSGQNSVLQTRPTTTMEGHMLVLVLFIVMVSSEEVKKNLTGTVGGSITLPDPVEEHGSLLFERKIITLVIDRKIVTYDEAYKDKVLWNNNTWLFTITRLQRNDSGIYSIDSKTGKVFSTSYKLTVYESVPTPAVETLDVSAESCTLQCLVEKAEETTLLWYKDEQILNQSSSCSYEHSERSVTDNPRVAVLQSWLFLIPMVVFVIAVAIYIILTNVKTERRRETTTAAPSAIN